MRTIKTANIMKNDISSLTVPFGRREKINTESVLDIYVAVLFSHINRYPLLH
jgi:hypothetical protein